MYLAKGFIMDKKEYRLRKYTDPAGNDFVITNNKLRQSDCMASYVDKRFSKLFATAPELLDSLNFLVNAPRESDNPTLNAAIERAKEIIKRAS